MRRKIICLIMLFTCFISMISCKDMDTQTISTKIIMNEENITNTIVFRASKDVFSLFVVVQSLDKDDMPNLSYFEYSTKEDYKLYQRKIINDEINGKKIILCSGNYSANGNESIIFKTDEGYKAINRKLGMMGWIISKDIVDISLEKATKNIELDLAKDRVSNSLNYLNYGEFNYNDTSYFYLVTSNSIEIYNNETLEIINTFTYETNIYGVKVFYDLIVVAYATNDYGFKIETKEIIQK